MIVSDSVLLEYLEDLIYYECKTLYGIHLHIMHTYTLIKVFTFMHAIDCKADLLDHNIIIMI